MRAFAGQGCWLTCHNGMRDTRDQKVGQQVKQHPVFKEARYSADIRKYLAVSRTDGTSWDKTKSPEEIDKLKAEGFTILPCRWVVERTISWINNHRRLSKDYEYAAETSQAFISVSMIDVMLKRMTKQPLTDAARRQLAA